MTFEGKQAYISWVTSLVVLQILVTITETSASVIVLLSSQVPTIIAAPDFRAHVLPSPPTAKIEQDTCRDYSLLGLVVNLHP